MIDFSTLDFKTAIGLLLSPDNEMTKAFVRAGARELLRRAEARAGGELTAEQTRRLAKHMQLIADTLNTIANGREKVRDTSDG